MLPDVDKLAVIMLFGIPLAAVVGGMGLAALKIIKGQPAKKDGELGSDEVRTIQEIHQGLLRMEKRVESLETILLEKAGKQKESLNGE